MKQYLSLMMHLGDYIEENGKEITGTPWEEYITDPTTVSNPYLIKTVLSTSM